ncbi:MAG: hypothetical protein KGQ59_05230, partial [Bdellovibrionales bacterium]|nr:hypothetical protein [Bdellovibrionales bacterium]
MMFSVLAGFRNNALLGSIILSGALAFLGVDPAFSAEKSLVNIRQVQVSENDRVDILLDGKLDSSQ